MATRDPEGATGPDESWRRRLTRWGFNLFPAFRATGARLTHVADDWREVRVRLPLNWRTRNYVGTLFGGSMYGALDPVYMIMLIKTLGRGYVVWDKAASIRFLRPGRETLFATFRLEDADVRAIRAAVAEKGKTEWSFTVELKNAAGEVHASCEKVLSIRLRTADGSPGPPERTGEGAAPDVPDRPASHGPLGARPVDVDERPVSAEPESPKRVYPPAYLLLAVVLMACLHVLVPVRRIIPAPYRYLGLMAVAAGVLLVVSVATMFRRAGTTIRPFETSSVLVVRGPYRFTRNPIYLGMVCALVGVALLAGSLTPFLVIPAFAYLIDRRFIQAEEAMLEQTFGSRYVDYKAGVRRWI